MDCNVLDTTDYWRYREEGELLRFEAKSLDGILATYAAHADDWAKAEARSPLEHHDLLNLDQNSGYPVRCGCATCREWVVRQQDYVNAVAFLPKGHRWHICTCSTCRFIAAAHTTFTAAANKRDLLISMAYNAKRYSPIPNCVMLWFEEEMQQPMYTTSWCAHHISQLPTKHWLKNCTETIGPVILGPASGSVFRGVEWQ